MSTTQPTSTRLPGGLDRGKAKMTHGAVTLQRQGFYNAQVLNLR